MSAHPGRDRSTTVCAGLRAHTGKRGGKITAQLPACTISSIRGTPVMQSCRSTQHTHCGFPTGTRVEPLPPTLLQPCGGCYIHTIPAFHNPHRLLAEKDPTTYTQTQHSTPGCCTHARQHQPDTAGMQPPHVLTVTRPATSDTRVPMAQANT